MSDPFGDRPFPRGALIAVVGLIVFTLVAVGMARWVGGTGTEPVTGSITESRELRFEDGRGGLVYVYAGTDESAIAVLEPGTENFIRGVLRGLARERRSNGIGMEPPFVITRYDDGRLLLKDPSTGRLIDLKAFGPTNAASFARFLDATPGRLPSPTATPGERSLASSAHRSR
jgi:putative photosynthetic complex assembly protein